MTEHKVSSFSPRRVQQPAVPAIPWARPDTIIWFLRGLTSSQWLLLIYPAFLFAIRRKRESDDVASVDTSAIFQIGFLGLCATVVVQRLAARQASFGQFLLKTPMLWLLLYTILAMLSASWSGLPMLTLFRGVQIFVFVVLIADAVASFAGVEELLKFQLCFAMVVGIFWQYTNLLDERSIGILHSSAIPGTMIGAAIAGYLILGRQWQWLYGAVVMTMLLGTSAAAYFCVLVGCAVAVMSLRGRHATLGLIAVGLLVLVVLQFPANVVHLVFYGKSDGNILNGTGRVPVWDWLIRTRVPQHPLLGFGFGFGEVQSRLFNEGAGALKMTHLHNAFMSALVNLGLVGTALLFAFWGGILRATWKLRDYPMRPVMIAAVVATLVDSLTMESVTAPLSYGFIGHLLVYVTVIRGASLVDADSTRPAALGSRGLQAFKGPQVMGR